MKNSRYKTKPQGSAESPIKETRTDVAGIDIGATEIYVSCHPRPGKDRNVRKFGADSQSLAQLADWLQEEKVVSVVMESTGVYWIPLYEVLSARDIEVVLVDARAVCGVPGHKKTDVLDCQWLRQLHASGLLKGCFLPDDKTAQLRTLQSTVEAFDFLTRQIAKVDGEIVCCLGKLREVREIEGKATATEVASHPDKSKQNRIRRDGQEPLRQELGKTFGDSLVPDDQTTLVETAQKQ